jgi:hypothetical protein
MEIQAMKHKSSIYPSARSGKSWFVSSSKSLDSQKGGHDLSAVSRCQIQTIAYTAADWPIFPNVGGSCVHSTAEIRNSSIHKHHEEEIWGIKYRRILDSFLHTRKSV